MDKYLMNHQNCIDFALWLFDRQTAQEKQSKQTIEENGIGLNHPDSLALSNLLICLKDKVAYDNKELVKIGLTHIKPRLLKYKEQFKIYDHSRTQEARR